jgi:hypothetical protein
MPSHSGRQCHMSQQWGSLGTSLFQRFVITTIPALTLLDKKRVVLCTNAWSRLISDPGGVPFPWRAPALRQVGERAVVNFDLPLTGMVASAQMLLQTTQLALSGPLHGRPPSFCTADPEASRPPLPPINKDRQPSSCAAIPPASGPPPQAGSQPFNGGRCGMGITHMPQEDLLDLPVALPPAEVHGRARPVRNAKRKAALEIVPSV